jgi:large subunit ribosomal protein L6
MSTKAKEIKELVYELPEGVYAKQNGYIITIKGKLGEVSKDFSKVRAEVKVKGNRVISKPLGKKKSDYAIANTAISHIKNMIRGVTEGFTYRLKIVYAHFPISVKVQKDRVVIENFIGERSPRIAKIIGNAKVKVEGDDVVVYGSSKEDVGQTAANIEQATKIKNKDQRVFLDGIFIYDKKVGMR